MGPAPAGDSQVKGFMSYQNKEFKYTQLPGSVEKWSMKDAWPISVYHTMYDTFMSPSWHSLYKHFIYYSKCLEPDILKNVGVIRIFQYGSNEKQ